MVYGVTNGLEQAKLETVPSFNTDAEVGKDKEALVGAIDVFEVIEAGDARAAGVPRLSIVEQVKLFISFGVAEHGVHEEVWILEIPSFVFPAISKGSADGQAASYPLRPWYFGVMTRSPFHGWCYGRALDGIGLMDGLIVSDDAELDDGSRVDRTSISFFANSAHS